MNKDFTVEVEVRLFPHCLTAANSPKKRAIRKPVNDTLELISCMLDESVEAMVERQITEYLRIVTHDYLD